MARATKREVVKKTEVKKKKIGEVIFYDKNAKVIEKIELKGNRAYKNWPLKRFPKIASKAVLIVIQHLPKKDNKLIISKDIVKKRVRDEELLTKFKGLGADC